MSSRGVGIWARFEGRDRDGDKFIAEAFIRGDGRVMAKVNCPMADEWFYRVVFILGPELDKEDYHFVDLDSAKRFVEKALVEAAVEGRISTHGNQDQTQPQGPPSQETARPTGSEHPDG